MSVDDKEMKKRQKQKNLIDEKVKASNPTLIQKDKDFLSSTKNNLPPSIVDDKEIKDKADTSIASSKMELIKDNFSTKDVKDNKKDHKSMDKNTAKILRVIYKTNMVKKIQKKFREIVNRRNMSIKKLNEINLSKPQVKENNILSIIKEENSVVKDEYTDIKLKTIDTNIVKVQPSEKKPTMKAADNKSTSKKNIAEVKFDIDKNLLDKPHEKEPSKGKEKDKENLKVVHKASDLSHSGVDLNSKIDNEENKDPSGILQNNNQKKNYYYGHKKTVDSKNDYKVKTNIEEKEKIIGGKFDMISLKADSIHGEKSQSGFYFSSKGKEPYRQTINSIKEVDKNESGVKRVNKSLLWNSPLEDSKVLYSYYIIFLLLLN